MESNSGKLLAVVTGASSGIGYELAKIFAKNGYDLIVAAEDAGITEAAQAFQNMGVTVDPVQVDLATYDGVEKLYSRIQARGQAVDAIAINAGVGVGGPFTETDLDAEMNLIDLNVRSAVHIAKRVIKDMVTVGHGRVLFTSSIAATSPGPFEAIYSASKAFIQSFSEALRHELKDKNVTVTSLQPGPTDTNFFARAGLLDTKVGSGPKDDAAEVAQEGFDAMMAGRDHIVAGSIKNNMIAGLGKTLPQTESAKIRAEMSKPGGAN